MGIEALKIKLSGGTANADLALSVGGAKSSVAVLSQSGTGGTAIPGVTVIDCVGNTVGNGTLTYTAIGKTLQWTPPGGAIGLPVSVGSTGTYLIRGASTTDGYVIVSTVAASLSGTTDYTRTLTIANQVELFLPSVDKDTAYAGATQYYCFYLQNDGASTIKNVRIQVQTDTPGLDTLSVGAVTTVNTLGTNDGSATTGHGVTFAAVGVDATMGDLATTDYWGFHVKRVIPALTVDGVTANTFKIKITSLT